MSRPTYTRRKVRPSVDLPSKDGTSWRAQALCAQPENPLDPEAWFPSSKEPDPDWHRDYTLAQAMCARCPVSDTCETYRDRTRSAYGIWGGKLEPHLQTA